METKKCTYFFLGLALVVSVWTTSIPSVVFAQHVDDLILMTEQYPPFNFKMDGKLQGISVDMIVLMLEKMDSKLTRKDIKLLPWARGYRNVLSKKNTCLFSTTRTEERENLFKWVGPIGINRVVLIGKKERNIKINSLEDIKQYNVGVIHDDVAEQLLVNTGINKDNLDRVSETLQNIRKLNIGRIDIWGYGKDVAKWKIKKNGFNPNAYETVYVLKEKELYYAFHKVTSDLLIQKLQGVLDDLKEQGEYHKILDKYLK